MTDFERDLNHKIIHDGEEVSIGIERLKIALKQLEDYIHGIKPYSGWRITKVKTYFGISGNRKEMLSQINKIKDIHLK